ncbi:NOI-like protein [Dioscorea cayenensis subsp. rotundata]|uniref:NOI-like protein n=1 Tax=Dioscorea cayennensis subsp. rotundata TaxID=55577 RepID=A0AB40BZA0_DIOCR|nr:NOI-like protein [Dioscorea cayenensis subsp. rotundata]
MAQKAHVPKFGNWESDNVPYTTYFENARKDKGAGGKMINPNDPEQNPDAFVSGIFPQAYKFTRPQQDDDESYDFGHGHFANVSQSKTMHSVKSPQKENCFRDDSAFQGFMKVPSPQNFTHQRGDFDPKTSKAHKSGKPDSTEKYSSDVALLSYQNRRSPAHYSPERSYMLSPPRQTTLKSENYLHNSNPQQHQRGVSVPKFGAWDENDLKSGEGFTIIFSKVKEEKQMTAARLPATPTEPKFIPATQQEHRNSSFLSKICCCFQA